MTLQIHTMDDKKTQEHTFLENGKIYYNMISEDRIREIIREEITEYNVIFMSQMKNPVEADMLDVKEENWEDEG